MTSRTERAWKLIRHEIDRQSRSIYPNDEVLIGMIQMAYAQGDITTDQELQLTREGADAVRQRHAELRQANIEKCIGGVEHDHPPRRVTH